MSGYCSIGSAKIESAPASMMRSAMTIAKIGRSMKNLAMPSPLLRCDRCGGLRSGHLRDLHGGARLRALHAADDHAIALFQAAFDDPLLTIGAGDLQLTQRDLVVGTDHQCGGVAL